MTQAIAIWRISIRVRVYLCVNYKSVQDNFFRVESNNKQQIYSLYTIIYLLFSTCKYNLNTILEI